MSISLDIETSRAVDNVADISTSRDLEVTRMWDPAQYLHFADERSRPFYDLVARIGATAPGYVVDLGCGPGQLTASLAARWPEAEVVGIDSSTEMVAAAQQADYGEAARRSQLSFDVGRRQRLAARAGARRDRLERGAAMGAGPHGAAASLGRLPSAGGWLAFQLPGNFDQPSHAVLRELAGSARWRDAAIRRSAQPPGRPIRASISTCWAGVGLRR